MLPLFLSVQKEVLPYIFELTKNIVVQDLTKVIQVSFSPKWE